MSLISNQWLFSLVLLFGTLFTGFKANAQVSALMNPTYGYTFSNTTTTYTTLSGGTVFQSGTTLNTDGVSASIALPFTFTYNGIKENNIFISNNGFITFGPVAPAANNYTPISQTTSTSAFDGVIAGSAMNCVASTAASTTPEIRYGSNAGGDFVVQFQDIGQSGFAAMRLTYQITLKADGKTVQIVYGPSNVGVSGAGQGQVGLRGTSQQDWNNRTVSSGGNWNTSGGASGTVAQAMSLTVSTTLPTSGRTFQWVPTSYVPTYLVNPAGAVQDFTTWANGSGLANVPSINFGTNGYGNPSWQIDNTTATTTTSGWTSTTGAYSPVDYVSASGGHSARFHSNATSAQVGYLDYYVNLSSITGTPTVDFYTINPSGTDVLQVYLSTNGGTSFTQLGSNIGVNASWTSKSLSLGSTNSATTIIRFKVISDAGSDDIGLDHLVVTPPAVSPTVTSYTPNTNLCFGGGQTVTITGTNFAGTTAVKFNGVNATSFTIVSGTSITAVTPASLTAGNVTVTNLTGTGTGSAYTVAASPTVILTPSTATICQPGGSAVTLTAGGASTYTYTNNSSLTPTTGSPVSANPIVSTTYIVTGTDANGCTGTASATVNIASSPFGVTATATPSTICSGGTSNLTSTGSAPNLSALPSTYTLNGGSTAYNAIVGTDVGFGAVGDDVAVGNLPIGFTFNYNGTGRTVFAVASNGFIELGSTLTYVDNSGAGWSTSSNALATRANIIAPLWDDNNTTGGSVRYTTTGSSPSRVLTVQWTGMHVGGGGDDTASTINMQVKLYEGTNKIEFIYGATSAALTSTSASIGVSGNVGNFLSVTPGSPASSTTTSNSSENTGVASAANFPSGTLYTITPPGATLTYAWTSPTTTVVSPSSANTATAALTATEIFTLTVSNGSCAATPVTATVTVSAGISIGTPPSNTTKCAGETATFTVAATGTGLTYQWRKGGININTGTNPSAATATLSLTNVTAADAATYDVVISSTCGTPATSTGAVLTVNPLPAATTVSGAGTFCSAATITASNGNDGTMYYQGITSNGTSTATPSTSQSVSTSGTYYFRAQSAAGCWGTQGSAAVVIQTPVTLSTTPVAICAGGSGSLAATGCLVTVNSGTTFNRTFTAGDAQALRPSTSIVQATSCSFDSSILRGYQVQQFQVSVTGSYTLDMTSTDDGMAYLYSGSFTPGTCGTWIMGDDDAGPGNDPQLIATLTAGVTYTLISTTYSSTTGNSTAAYTWTASTVPPGGQLLLVTQDAGTIQWYTAGGALIGTGSPFNPAGVAGSGLADTNTPGTTTYYAACSLNSACRTPVNFVINPNYTITATAGANGSVTPSGVTTVCSGGNQSYTITANSGYHIVAVTVNGGSQGVIASYNFTNVTSNQTISATFAPDCINVALTSATPTASPICADATTTLTYTGLSGTNAHVTWTQNADGTGATYGTTSPSNPVAPGTYYAYAVGDCGAPVSIQVVVGSQALPNAGTNGTLTICAGSTVTASQLFAQLGGSPQAGGTWSPTLAGAETYTYTVNATSPCNTAATATVTVSEQAQPNAGTNGTLTICSSNTLTASQLFASLGGTPQAGGTWSPTLAGAGVYTYTVNATSPCTGNATATVTVTVEAAANAGSNGTLTICSGSTVTASQLFAQLGGSPQAGGSWSPTLAGAGTYTYTINAVSPCTGSAAATVTVTEQAAPNAGTNGTLTICSSSTLTTSQLFASLGGTPQAGGSWSPTLAGAGVYTYTVNATSPCTGNATATVMVTSQAAANAGTNGTLTICAGSTVTASQLFAQLGGSPQAGGSWSPTLAGAGTYTYTINAVSPCTTNATATVTVTSQAAPNAGSNGALTICLGTTVTASQLFAQLTGTPSAGGTWTPALAGAGTYTYTVLATSPCTTNATATVTVNAVSCQATQLSNCGNIPVLTSVNTRIYANNTVTAATKYRFRVAVSTAPTTYFYAETTYPSFRLTDVVGLTPTYGTTYNVDIQNEFLISGNTVTSAYGPMCSVTTQAVTNITVPTNQCGQTLAAINSKVYVNGVTGATMYTFRVAKQSAPTVYSYIDSPYSNFRLTNAPTSGTVAIEHSTVYLVAVSVTTSNGASNFNGECLITTPSNPVTTLQASQCGEDQTPYVVPTKSTKVYAADFVSGATYTFKLEQYDAQSNLVATKFATSPINYFDCNMFTGTNSLLPNTLYHVYVSINYYGQGPYDHDCVIKTPAALKQEEMTQGFTATAYPNPFANDFMVDVKSSSQSVVNVKVYDMIGRLIDQRDVKMADLETTTLGNNYPSGVYNLVVSQQNSVETVRTIKR